VITAQTLTKILQQPDYSVTGSFTAVPVTARPTVWRGERDFQRAVVDAYAVWAAAHGVDAVLCHIANENAHRQPGIVAGMPDLALFSTRGVMLIELKVGVGKCSKTQTDLHHRLRMAGYRVVVVWDSVDEVMQAIADYLAETT
jgi:hypothetical protein